MAILSSLNSIRQGMVLLYNDAPYVVVWADFMRTAQRKPVKRTKLSNLLNGKVIEQTFKPGDKVAEADVERTAADYLYHDGENYYFMDKKTMDQFFFKSEQIGEQKYFLLEGASVDILYFNGQPVSVMLPKKVSLEVVDAPEAVKGDTQNGGVKRVKLESGYEVAVPLFIKNGEKVIINTETGDYVERA